MSTKQVTYSPWYSSWGVIYKGPLTENMKRHEADRQLIEHNTPDEEETPLPLPVMNFKPEPEQPAEQVQNGGGETPLPLPVMTFPPPTAKPRQDPARGVRGHSRPVTPAPLVTCEEALPLPKWDFRKPNDGE